MSSKKVIELFYDVVSPYSWFGFELMCRYRTVWNVEVKLRPALLGGVMQGSGIRSPGMVPDKSVYMTHDLQRFSNHFEVPLSFPSDPTETIYKKGSLSAMRFVTAVQKREKDGDKQVEQVSRELWRRIWSQDKDITEPASLSEAAKKAAQRWMHLLDYKSIGLPMMVCHIDGKPEMYFGSDRFELMAHSLDGDIILKTQASPVFTDDDVTLCYQHQSGKHKQTSFFKNRALIDSNSSSGSDRVIKMTLKNVTREDEGFYRCASDSCRVQRVRPDR
ncbi:unnamed protein product, partial [Pleuronectes platessa]